MPKRVPRHEIARQRQVEMKQSAMIKLLIGLGLIGLGVALIFTVYSTQGFVGGVIAVIFGAILAQFGWNDYQDARRVERDMYLRGQ